MIVRDDRPWQRPDLAGVRKLLVALAAALAIAGTGLADGTFDTVDAIQVALAFLGALGVYQVPNVPKPPTP